MENFTNILKYAAKPGNDRNRLQKENNQKTKKNRTTVALSLIQAT